MNALLTEAELRVADLAANATAIEAIAEALGVAATEAAALLEAVYRKLGGTGGPEPPEGHPGETGMAFRVRQRTSGGSPIGDDGRDDVVQRARR